MITKRWKRGLTMILVFLQLFTMTAHARPDWPSDVGIEAEAGALLDMDSGTIILGQNSHVEYPPASITKLLTALIVVENANLSDVITYSDTAMNSVEADSGNKFSLVAGDTMTVEEALYMLLLQSVNQAGNALAEHVAGSIPAFVDMMNERVTALGLSESHFENPSGLNGDTHYVSAYDMAMISRDVFNNEKVLEISSTLSKKIGAITNHPDGFTVNNEHRLVYTTDTESPYYCPEAKAGKTGYLLKAGNTLVTYAEKDGRRLVSVILKGSPRQYFVDGKALLDFGFSRFQNVSISENEKRFISGDTPVEVNGASYNPSELMVEPGRVMTLPNNAGFADAEVYIDTLPANYPKGAVGVLKYIYNERTIGSAFLVKEAEYTGEMIYGQPVAGGAQNPQPEAGGENSGDSNPGGEGSEGNGAEGENAGDTVGDGNIPASSPEAEAGGGNLILILVGLVFLALLGAGGAFLFYRRKKEQEEAARRRERRRRRLMEEGPGVEAEFNRLLEEKRNRNSGNNKWRPL